MKKPGSSPRGRGKRRRLVVAGDHVGLIPARAGKTSSAPSWQASRPAHPRAGGENALIELLALVIVGSSPRGRGKLEPFDDDRHGGRLIPARAGKTSARDDPWLGLTAHPRAGGENKPASALTWTASGSSPRGRGKRPARRGPRRRIRLIPARAGKTGWRCVWPRNSGAHPRAGGENAARRVLRGTSRGSSPRGRGKPLMPWQRQVADGLIPARAGKTHGVPWPLASPAAHPRAGGENLDNRERAGDDAGSSPRGRGKHFGDFAAKAGTRLIPARAGKTTRATQSGAVSEAHPRAGGENAPMIVLIWLKVGSSPRGRGKPDRRRRRPVRPRLIPARAGKTPLWH